MSIFASYFWLWSIVGLLCLLFVSTLGAVMNFFGFVTPLKRIGRWVDDAPALVKLAVIAGIFGVLAYPSVVHRLWADATAVETRHRFSALPEYPDAVAGPPTEQMNGLYDPTGTDGTYILGWYGTEQSFDQVEAFYVSQLTQQGWTEFQQSVTGRRVASTRRVQFRDQPEPARAHYELLVTQVPPNSREAPASLAGKPTLFAVRLGVVDPRATTQVSWFIDCLVQRAPTFPSCEAMGWNPIEKFISPE
ncbi:MAG TPA: hypothetical protein VFC51_09020 [Chloroflexota bacterium]|nr:hypothetical protein [Chloroflexota bacterium]